jgi:EmrB/QacA subfamily drug resistance transporter
MNNVHNVRKSGKRIEFQEVNTRMEGNTDKAKRYGFVMAVYLLGIFIGAIDTGILTPARTVVQNSLGVDGKTGIWMITAFTLAYASAMPILGKLADRIGRKKVYMASIALFGTGSLLCGLSNFSDSFFMLIAGRVVQALGGGGIMPLATAEFGTGFPEEKRGMALGLVGGVYGVANILGATLGSAILDIVGTENWHWLFFINLPICLLVVASGLFVLPKGEKKPAQRIDLTGALVLLAMILSLLYGIDNLDFFDFGNTFVQWNVFPFLILFAGLIPVFLLVEKKAADPIFNTGYFKNRNILIIFILSLIVGICLMGMVFVPQFAENALKTPAGSGGYFVTILGVFSGIAAPLSGRLVDKHGPKRILLLGFAVSIAGALFLALYATRFISAWAVVVSLVLVGTGLGFVMGTPLNYMMLANTKKEESNAALSALSLMRSIGTTIGPMIMIGFIAQAGISAQDAIMDVLPPVSSVAVQADQSLTGGIRENLLFIRDSAGKVESAKLKLSQKISELEGLNKNLDAATAKRTADYGAVKKDPQFKSMLKKMDMPDMENANKADFAEIRDMLAKSGNMDVSKIDESLGMLDFKNNTDVSFDMNGDAELPEALVNRLQSADVNSIVEDTVLFADYMFGQYTPAVIADIQSGIGEGLSGMQSGLDGMNEAKAGIADGMDGLVSGIDGIGQGIEGAGKGLEGMRDGLKGMDKAVRGINKGISGINSGVSDLNKAAAGVGKGIAGMKQGISQMDEQIAGLQQELKAKQDAGLPPYAWAPLQGQIAGLQAAKAGLEAKLDKAVADRKKMEAAVKKMKANIGSMRKSIAQIKNARPKLSRLMRDVEAEKDYMEKIKAGMETSGTMMGEMSGLLTGAIAAQEKAKSGLETLRGEIPGYFEKAKNSYLEAIRAKKGEIESVFQSTVNNGFTQMYYAVAVFSTIAAAALIFYRQAKRKEKVPAA